MKRETAVKLLGQTALFADLEAQTLDAIAAEGRDRSYKRGAAIFHEGDPGDAFYVVVAGSVKVFVVSGLGEEVVSQRFAPRDHRRRVPVRRRSALCISGSAGALGAARVPTNTMAELARREARVSEALLRSAGALLRRLTVQTADLVFLDLEGRIAKLLVVAAERNPGRW